MIYTAILSTAFYNLILGNFDPLKTQLKLLGLLTPFKNHLELQAGKIGSPKGNQS